MPHALRSLRHRNYQLFFSGQLVSLVGTWMQSMAQAWLVYRLTRSPALLGLVAFAGQIPVLLFAPVGGAIADRASRHRVVLWTQTTSMLLAFVLAALTLTGVVRVWHIFTLATLLGVVNAIDIPTRQSFVVQMVGRQDLMNAIALNSSIFNAARVVGPAVGGIILTVLGEGWCFLLNGVSYIAVIAGLLLMDMTRVLPATTSDRSPIDDIADGFRFVVETAPIRTLLLLLGTVSFATMPYSVLMPVFAEEILRGGATSLALLMGASGTGALGGALWLATRQGVRGLGRWIGFSTVGVGLALLLFSASTHFWLSMALLVPVGGAMIMQMAASNTLIQAMVPDPLRGRVMAVYSMMLLGGSPFGGLFAGAVAERTSAPAAVALSGVICIAAAGVFFVKLPSIRDEARQLIAAQDTAG